jgi:hypothetical protein
MSPVILFILGVVFVAVGIAVSIALHEVGHLVPAKLFKVRVTKYMIGFGPTIWSTKKGETEYGFKALPLGGYVSMIGMYPPNKEDGSVRPSQHRHVPDAGQRGPLHGHEDVGPGDENRVFLPAPGLEEDHHHAGRPGNEPADRPRAHGRAAHGVRHLRAHHHHRRRFQVPGEGGGDSRSELGQLQTDSGRCRPAQAQRRHHRLRRKKP